MSAANFIAKWRHTPLPERAAAQQHFLELCDLLDVPRPPTTGSATADYRFEAPVIGTDDKPGFADAFKRNCFAWEYKKRRTSLVEARKQLLRYAGYLDNPPLLIACDHNIIEITLNFTGFPAERAVIHLEELIDPLVRARTAQAWTNPITFRPTRSRAQLTEEVAERFSILIERLKGRHHSEHDVSHFVNQLLFCLFAEHVGLLPDRLFERFVNSTREARATPVDVQQVLEQLFGVMGGGGFFGVDRVEWFNGRLFDDSRVLPLEREDMDLLGELAAQDWSAIEPAIFGTLFERRLSPNWRGATGTHYTPRDKIERIIDAVVTKPLRNEWVNCRVQIESCLRDARQQQNEAFAATQPRRRARAMVEGLFGDTLPEMAAKQRHRRVGSAAARRRDRLEAKARKLLSDFLHRLRGVRVLDPAAGSGNFLYVALVALKDLELEILTDAERLGFSAEFPQIGPEAVLGIELDPYAVELAHVVVWIGELQWMLRKGFGFRRDPVLRRLDMIVSEDAVLQTDAEGCYFVPEWPEAEIITGNPPFLGRPSQRKQLGDEYVDALRSLYAGRVPADADLACYWFEKARDQVVRNRARRVGLVVTSKIAFGQNRMVLNRIDGRVSISNADEHSDVA